MNNIFNYGKRELAVLNLKFCFALIGVGQLVAQAAALYRLLTFSVIASILLLFCIAPPGRYGKYKVSHGLLLAAPIYFTFLLFATRSNDSVLGITTAAYIALAVIPGLVFGAMAGRRFSGFQLAEGLIILILPFVIYAAAELWQGQDPLELGKDLTLRTTYGILICFLGPVYTGAYLLTRQFKYVIAVILTLIILALLESRVAVLFTLPFMCLTLFVYNKKIALRYMALGILILGVILAATGDKILARFDAHNTNFSIDDSVIDELALPDQQVDIERRLQANTALHLFFEHPILGAGFTSVLQYNDTNYLLPYSAHGYFPGNLGELGIVGVSVIMLILFTHLSWVGRAKRIKSADPMLAYFQIGYCAYLLTGFFHQALEPVYFGVMFGMLLGLAGRSYINEQIE